MKLFYKNIYEPRFKCYHFSMGVIHIVNGVLQIFASFFGNYTCNLFGNYCEWNLKKDVERSKLKRSK